MLPFREEVMEDFLSQTSCCTSEAPECCEPPPQPACDPAVTVCAPVELDPDDGPTVECDPTSESCGPMAEDPQVGLPMPTVEMDEDDAQALGRLTSEPPPRFEDFDLERFIALECELRRRQSPRTISGRPNVGGH